MKSIHPLELEARIETNETVEILDLRPRCHFEKRHVRGSHSLPFNEFHARTLVRSRELPWSEPLYLISERGEHAQIAADSMERQGRDNLVVVEGGMHNWDSNGLPVDRSQSVTNWVAEHHKKMVDLGAVTDLSVTAVLD